MENKLNKKHDWFGAPDAPLLGFSWRSGTRRDTTGILMWSDVFLHDKANGDEIAIILLDTQGLFDNETSVAENSLIFSLSNLLSSYQILNLSGIIQEDQLQYLQFATEFAAFSSSKKSMSSKPFQKFMFLIRDWSNPDEFEFGSVGGLNYLNETLKIKPTQSKQLKSVREHIEQSFDILSCCLLPYPGKFVARDATYDGRWSKMDEEFASELKALISDMMSPENLIEKKISDVPLTSAQFNEAFKQFVKLFQASTNPPVASIYDATVDNFMLKLVEKSFELFKSKLGAPKSESEIDAFFNASRDEAVGEFRRAKKMGNAEQSEKYLEILQKKISNQEVEFRNLAMLNIAKIRSEIRRRTEANQEAERLKIIREEEDKKAKARIAQLEKEAKEREAAAEKLRQEIYLKELEVKQELERQRVAEEQRLRALAEQRRLEEERRRAEEERISRDRDDEERRKILIRIHEGPIHIDVPKPKCEIM